MGTFFRHRADRVFTSRPGSSRQPCRSGRRLSSVMAGQEPRTGVPASVASVSHPATKLEIFAQGVSRPEDDERLPRPQDKRPQISTDESNGGSNVAPVVRVTAAPPPATAAAPSPQKPEDR